MSNLPPGVTGDEFEIAGPDAEEERDRYCRRCEDVQPGMLQAYWRHVWWVCDECGETEDVNEW